MEVSWFCGQSKVQPSDNYRLESDNNMFSLSIASVTREDSDQWRCLGVNAYGQCMCVCRLDVLGTLLPYEINI